MWMAEAAAKERWNHTSALLAMTANVNRDPKKSRAFKPADFHPYMGSAGRKSGTPLKAGNIGILKMFVKKKGARK